MFTQGNHIDDLNTEQIRTRIQEYFLKREEINFVYLFGSFVTSAIFRDIDIAVHFKDEPGLIEFGVMKTELEERISLPIDLVKLNQLPGKNPLFAYEVVTDGELILNNDPLSHTEYKLACLHHYHDTRYLREQMDSAFKKRLDLGHFGKRNYE